MGARCCGSDIWACRRRFRVNRTDCGRAAETHADTNDHVERGGDRGRQSGDIPSVRQGKQRQRPGADGVGLPLRWLRVPWLPRLRLRWFPWLWLRLRLRLPRLRLPRLRLPLRRLRLATCRPGQLRVNRDCLTASRLGPVYLSPMMQSAKNRLGDNAAVKLNCTRDWSILVQR